MNTLQTEEPEATIDPGEADEVVYTNGAGGSDTIGADVRQALVEFLGLPLLVVLFFIILAGVVLWLDRSDFGWVQRLRQAISHYVFKTTDASGATLGLLATGLLTMTSLIISMLLLALQQTATNMGNLIYDQFMKRRRNQLYAGYTVGTVVLTFLLRSTTSDTFNPILAATTATITAMIGIVLLLYFLYSTMNQMRPHTIMRAIHDDALRSRRGQMRLLRRTRRTPQLKAAHAIALRSVVNGYVLDLDVEAIAAVFSKIASDVEVEACATIGAYVAYHDLVAWVKADHLQDARAVANLIGEAFVIGQKRSEKSDPKYSLEQLEMMSWTEMSSAKENPETGLMAVHATRDLLTRWLDAERSQEDTTVEAGVLPFVYPDSVIPATLNMLESLALITSESKQHQGLSATFIALALLVPRFPADLQDRSRELIVRVLPTLEQHVLSRELDYSLSRLAASLENLGCQDEAQMVREARQKQAKKLPRQLPSPAPSPLLSGRPAIPGDGDE